MFRAAVVLPSRLVGTDEMTHRVMCAGEDGTVESVIFSFWRGVGIGQGESV